MDFERNDEQRLIRDTARPSTDNESSSVRARTTAKSISTSSWSAKIADQGYLGAIVPREYGGAGLDHLTYGLVVEQIGRGDSAITVISVQTSLVCSSILSSAPSSRSTSTSRKLCSGAVARCSD